MPAIRSDIHLAADNWLDFVLLSNLIEVDRAVHAAVVGDGKAIHAELFVADYQILKPAQAVKHTEFSVDMEMSEQAG